MRTFAIGLLWVTLLCGAARGDLRQPPSVRAFSSPDGGTLVRVVPRPSGEDAARATVLKFDRLSGDYRRVTEFGLRNELAPVDVIVTTEGQFIVTFDDWGALGLTDNVVVVYRSSGELVKAWRLADIFSPAECASFLRSIGSVFWRGDVELIEFPREQTQWVRIRLHGWTVGGDNRGRELILDLKDLQFRKEKKPNKAPEPTPTSVTSPAIAR